MNASTTRNYTGGRPMLDADSHLMELPGFLDRFMPADMVDRLKGRGMERLAPLLDRATDASAQRRRDDATRAAAEDRLLLDKGWLAMGAFDPAERSHVARHVRLRRSARVRHLRGGDVHGQGPRSALRRERGPQLGDRRLLQGRPAPAPCRVHPARRPAAGGDAAGAGHHGRLRRDPPAVDRCRRPLADPP